MDRLGERCRQYSGQASSRFWCDVCDGTLLHRTLGGRAHDSRRRTTTSVAPADFRFTLSALFSAIQPLSLDRRLRNRRNGSFCRRTGQTAAWGFTHSQSSILFTPRRVVNRTGISMREHSIGSVYTGLRERGTDLRLF